MEKTVNRFTVVNYVMSGVLWLLGILMLLFNILGLWVPWHLAGFAFVFYIPIIAILQIIAIIFSCVAKNKKIIIMNFASLFISIAFALFTIFVSGKWFW